MTKKEKLNEVIEIEYNSIVEMINALNISKNKMNSKDDMWVEYGYMLEKATKLNRYLQNWRDANAELHEMAKKQLSGDLLQK